MTPFLSDRGINPLIAKRNTEHGSGLGYSAEPTPFGKCWIERGETDMGDKGKKDKGKKEQRKKAQLSPKEKRKQKKEKKNK